MIEEVIKVIKENMNEENWMILFVIISEYYRFMVRFRKESMEYNLCKCKKIMRDLCYKVFYIEWEMV